MSNKRSKREMISEFSVKMLIASAMSVFYTLEILRRQPKKAEPLKTKARQREFEF
jgi:hypothetical protein